VGDGDHVPGELLFELLDAVDAVLGDASVPPAQEAEARHRARNGGRGGEKGPEKGSLGSRLARWFGRRREAPAELSARLRGLALAREQAVERLARLGVDPMARSGGFDPVLHTVIDIESVPHTELHETLAHTYRCGWVHGRSSERRVLRHAQVRVYRSEER
jgi:hypothetical protein